MLHKLTAMTSPSAFTEGITVGNADYIVVTLRKCARGGPMLPVLSGGAMESWERPAAGAFRMPLHECLCEFLGRLRLPMEAHANLNGWVLPPYQAAVRRDMWDHVSDLPTPLRWSVCSRAEQHN